MHAEPSFLGEIFFPTRLLYQHDIIIEEMSVIYRNVVHTLVSH